jgi:hypothetical protein
MKKLLPSALLALSVIGFTSADSFAGCFGLIPHHGCCGHCGHCGAMFCVRQYNAFSPVACGSLCLDGVAPFCAGGGSGGACAGGMCPGGFCGVNFSGLPACSGCMGSLPASEEAAPGAPKSTTGSNPIVTPSPLPSQMPAGPTSQMMSERAIQITAYPVSYPVYTYPYATMMQAQPQIMVAPAYWDK